MADVGPVSPAVQLRVLLAQARAEGLEFNEAWEWALKKVKWPHDTDHRKEWKRVPATKAQRRAWQSAYMRDGVSTRREESLGRLVGTVAA